MAIKKALRIKKKSDFDHIFSAKNSTANKKFIVYQIPAARAHFRVAISVSKKLGNAVTRNRIKRLVRHAIMSLSPNLPPVDFVVICRPGVDTLSLDEVTKNLKHVLKVAKIYQMSED